MTPQKLKIDLLSRPGCHLCNAALAVLVGLCEEFPIEVVKVDISSNLDLLREYGNDIPVGLVGGEELFRHPAKTDVLRSRLAELLSHKGLP